MSPRNTEYIERCLTKKRFEEPTCIQSQGWPIVLSGRDMVGIAQTGSGKTLAYVLPALVHISHQKTSDPKDGPTVLVLAPTRELAQQIQTVCEDFGKPADIQSVCIVGGVSIHSQLDEIQRGPRVCIATPGRLIDLINSGGISLKNCSFVVIDEADRMMDIGFMPQIETIFWHIRSDRQTLMFSATWPEEVHELAENFMADFVRVHIGSAQLTANHNITQLVDVVEVSEKTNRMCELVAGIMAKEKNKILIFVNRRKRVKLIMDILNMKGLEAAGIHGGKSQDQRNAILAGFRRGTPLILVATDVAARGLDVDDIKFVINLDFPPCLEDYVHRIGRTARSNKTGTAHTFFCHSNFDQAKDLVKILQQTDQPINPKLLELTVAEPKSSGRRNAAKTSAAAPPSAG